MPEGETNENQNIDAVIIEEKITKTDGTVVIKKYSRGKALGRGGFAKCYEVTNLETKRISAAKIIAKNSLNRSRAKQKVSPSISSAHHGNQDPQSFESTSHC